MKKVIFLSMILCIAVLSGCQKEPGDKPDNKLISGEEPLQPAVAPTPMANGALIFNGIQTKDVNIDEAFPEGRIAEKSKSSLKSSTYEVPVGDFTVNDYRFKLVAQKDAIIDEAKILPPDDKWGGVLQATHVKVDGKYAFVSYNHKTEPNIGGLVVYEYEVTDGPLTTATVTLTQKSSIAMPKSQINAIDLVGDKLYLAGACEEDNVQALFGKTSRETDFAFFMVFELNSDRTFKYQEPVVKQLTSFQATSICASGGKVYITTGDGANNTHGGLFIYNAADVTFDNSLLGIRHARSVDVDGNNIYLYQANPARITKYNLDCTGEMAVYNETDEALQKDAKSEILAWKDYLFLATNESGLRMVNKSTGALNQALQAPNRDGADWDREEDVTNSMSVNSDPKKKFYKEISGNTIVDKQEVVNSDLLLVANGVQGIYWYDVMKPTIVPEGGNKDKLWVVSGSVNSILGGRNPDKTSIFGSANYVTSKNNVVFVADGVGGLKVLYIGFNAGDVEPPIAGDGCMEFMPYLYQAPGDVLLPEGASVFRSTAHQVVKQLSQLPTIEEAREAHPDYIEITRDNVPLYITYASEGAGYANALGYFVIPGSVQGLEAEWNYYVTNIKPKMTTKVGTADVLNKTFDGGGTIFSYVRDVIKGGHMAAGSVYQIGGAGKTFNKGDKVVIFMVPDGWNAQNNRVQVTFSASTQQLFFMHKGFNEKSKVTYASNYGKFAGCQIASFYTGDCMSMVLCIEDIANGSDLDFNDIIFAVSDNIAGTKVTGFIAPKYAIFEKESGGVKDLEIIETKDILKEYYDPL